MRKWICLMIVMTFSAAADGYMMQGVDIVVDYWAGAGSNETIVVIDWNLTNGPYETESHTWGFRWDGTAYVSEALAAIDAAGALEVTTSYAGQFVYDAFYQDLLIDGDNHTSTNFSGWWWLGDTMNGGATWTANEGEGGITSEILGNGKIEGLNLVQNYEEWLVGSSTLTIPVPEPFTITLLGLGGLIVGKRRGKERYGNR